jgi:tetratricopeptide (TPR) repeat protein
VSTLRRAEGEERAAVAALAVVVVAYGVDGLIEFNWDYVALSAPALLTLGLLLGRGASTQRMGALPALALAGVVAAMLFSFAAPWLSARKVEKAREAIANAEESAQLAEEAHDLNPLAVEPLLLWADAEEAKWDPAAARRLYVEAVELQPENFRTWRELGEFELAIRRFALAEKYLSRARELDPRDPLTQELLERLP